MNAITVIQFLCPDPEDAEELKEIILEVANEFSGLPFRAEDPEYITNPLGMDEWREHTQTSGLWWANYGEIYKHLGGSGRKLAERFFGFAPKHGILRHAPLLVAHPEMRLQILDVQDPVAQGYLPAPEVNEP